MTINELIRDLDIAFITDDYRAFQRALKNYRDAGYRVDVKLNSKKAHLHNEAVFIINRFYVQGEEGLPKAEPKTKKTRKSQKSTKQAQQPETNTYDAYEEWLEQLRREQAEQQRRQEEARKQREAEQAEASELPTLPYG